MGALAPFDAGPGGLVELLHVDLVFLRQVLGLGLSSYGGVDRVDLGQVLGGFGGGVGGGVGFVGEGRSLALPTPETNPWLARIQAAVARGYRWYRVHILDQPLSDYTRYELWGYRANQAAGEEIYLADRETHADLQQLREDFWLIDNTIAIRMIYDDEGRSLRSERVPEPGRYREMREIALRHAGSLDEYLARRRPRLTV